MKTLKQEMYKDLRDIFFKEYKNHKTYDETALAISKLSAPKYYVSFEYARRIISRIHKNLPIDVYITNKKRYDMYLELYDKWKKEKTNNFISLHDILETPASSFFLTPITIKNIILRNK